MKEITEKKKLTDEEILHITECILFVSGEPVYFEELARLFAVDKKHIREIAMQAEKNGIASHSGTVFNVTDSTVQLVSNKEYNDYVVEFLQPTQIKSFSQSMLETLTIVAYKQPVTRAEIDSIRGIRSEYSVTQLLKQGFIEECGRKEVLGRPMLFGTTDKFLRKFGLHSLDELPEFERFSETELLPQNEDDNNG